MVIYNWDCKTVDVNPTVNDYTDVVFNIHWKAQGSLTPEGGSEVVSDRIMGEQVVGIDPNESFISFDDLTNAILTGWVKSALGEDEVLKIEQKIQNDINEQMVPSTYTVTIED